MKITVEDKEYEIDEKMKTSWVLYVLCLLVVIH